MLTVGGLATSALAKQDNGLILTSGKETPIGSLRHAVDVRGCVLFLAALKHLHDLDSKEDDRHRLGNNFTLDHITEHI